MPDSPETRRQTSGPVPPFPGPRPVPTAKRPGQLSLLFLVGACSVVAITAVLTTALVVAGRKRTRPSVVVAQPDTFDSVAACVVRQGEILPVVLGRAGLSSDEIGRVVPALRDWGFNMRTMRPGDSVVVLRRAMPVRRGRSPESRIWSPNLRSRNSASALCRVLYRRSFENVYCVDVDSAQCRVSMLVRTIRREPALIRGTIATSLYEALIAQGEGPALIADYADIFGWEVDFFSETQAGDSFLILVERKYADTVFVGYGDVLAARYAGQVGAFNGYRFSDAEGHTDCYNELGQSLRKTFLKSPLRFSRVSSFFGRRFHPIRRVVRQHHGVDYVAPSGTPVDCVADGRVVSAGWSGGYGRLVVVGHAQGYETRYGHLRGFGRGIRAGAAVTQGQVVGYVGSTGLSTGPHLHYEVRKFGSAVNPLRLNPPRAAPVRLPYQASFAATRDRLNAMIAALGAGQQPPPVQTPH